MYIYVYIVVHCTAIYTIYTAIASKTYSMTWM